MSKAGREQGGAARRLALRARSLLLLASLSLYTAACLLLAQEHWTNEAYSSLSIKPPQDDADEELSRPSASMPLPEHLKGFIRVEGTNINLPVAQTTAEQPDTWFLNHDLWGQPSLAGCPYLDGRSLDDGEHLLIYGHRMGANGMFGSVSRAYRQRVFEGLSLATWTRRNGETRVYRAAFALHVDASYGSIQRFRFSGTGDMRSWLFALKEDSSASHPEAEELINRARSVATLVTCSNPLPGRPERTLVVFIEEDGGNAMSAG